MPQNMKGMSMHRMNIVSPKRYLFRRLEVGEDSGGCLFRLYGLRVGIRAWLHRQLYGRDDFCEFCVCRDRIELTDEFKRTTISSRLDKFESDWARSWTGPSLIAIMLIIFLLILLSNGGGFRGVCVIAAIGWFVWHLYYRSLTLSLSMKDEAGRKIVFDLKRGDFSGPPLPVQALNEMVSEIGRLSDAAKKGEEGKLE